MSTYVDLWIYLKFTISHFLLNLVLLEYFEKIREGLNSLQTSVSLNFDEFLIQFWKETHKDLYSFLVTSTGIVG